MITAKIAVVDAYTLEKTEISFALMAFLAKSQLESRRPTPIESDQ